MSKKNNIKKLKPLDNLNDLFIYVTNKDKGATGFLDGGFKMDKNTEEIFLNFNIMVKYQNNVIMFFLSTLKNRQTGDVLNYKDKIKFHQDAMRANSSGMDTFLNRIFTDCEFLPNSLTPASLEEAVVNHVASKISPPLTNTNEINFIKLALSDAMFKKPIDNAPIIKFWANYESAFLPLQQKASLEHNIAPNLQDPLAFKV